MCGDDEGTGKGGATHHWSRCSDITYGSHTVTKGTIIEVVTEVT